MSKYKLLGGLQVREFRHIFIPFTEDGVMVVTSWWNLGRFSDNTSDGARGSSGNIKTLKSESSDEESDFEDTLDNLRKSTHV